jgi:hypothetical protein
MDLTQEIRRGEAIGLGAYNNFEKNLNNINNTNNFNFNNISWFRVSTLLSKSNNINNINNNNNENKNLLQPSVNNEPKLVEKNNFFDSFNSEILPLDGDYDGNEIYNNFAIKHGCTNDIKNCWFLTVEDLKKFENDENLFNNELMKLNLLNKNNYYNLNNSNNNDNENKNLNKKTKRKSSYVKKIKRNRNETLNNFNAHLKGF